MNGAKLIQFYTSSNGDTWFLGRDPVTHMDFVRHKANIPSGGHVTDIAIDAFLSGQRNAEHEALSGLIGSLVPDTHGANAAVEPAVENTGKEWCDADLSELEDLLMCEISIKEIARLLGRDHADVQDKATELGGT